MTAVREGLLAYSLTTIGDHDSLGRDASKGFRFDGSQIAGKGKGGCGTEGLMAVTAVITGVVVDVSGGDDLLLNDCEIAPQTMASLSKATFSASCGCRRINNHRMGNRINQIVLRTPGLGIGRTGDIDC